MLITWCIRYDNGYYRNMKAKRVWEERSTVSSQKEQWMRNESPILAVHYCSSSSFASHENFLCLNKRNLFLLTKARPSIKIPIIAIYMSCNQFSVPSKTFIIMAIPKKLVKISPLMKFLTRIGQESHCLHKSSAMILTLSPQSSLPRVIENSLKGIVDSQERKLNQRRLSWFN